MSKKAKISVRDLRKRFGRNHVLKGVTLDVREGESVVVIGGSGTGKSVLVKCILGLIEPNSGKITVDGEDLTSAGRKGREAFLKKTGVLFQGGALFDSLPVWENVAFGLIQGHKMEREKAHKIALSKLKRVGLGKEVADLYPAELSGGMKKRVALARAIAANPEIIFFDEPTTGLDPIMAGVINDLITECVNELGATTVTITHDMASVRKVADRVAMLHGGKIVWQGTRKEMGKTKNPYVRQFVKGQAKGPIDVGVREEA